jgi:hypothetical protein
MSDRPQPIKTTHSVQVERGVREHQNADRLQQRKPLDAFEARHNPVEATYARREGERLMQPPEGIVGAGSTEVMPPISTWPTRTNERFYIIDTLDNPNIINVDASEVRSTLALRAGSLSLALDAAQSTQAANGIEKALAHQTALTHFHGMKLLELLENQYGPRLPPVEIARIANAAARLFEVSQSAALAQQKFRTGGTQRVEVQYQQVHVSGGQAVVTNTLQPRRRRTGRARASTGGRRSK